jgi:hypothetical protein
VASGTISHGAHARTSARGVGSAAPREAPASRLAELPVSALAPVPAHHAAPAPATPTSTPGASDLAPVFEPPALGLAAAAPAFPPAPYLLPTTSRATAPPHPPPALGLSQAFGPVPALHGLLELGPAAAFDPTAAFRGATVPDPLPVFGDLAGLPGPAPALVAGPAGVLTGPLDPTAAVLDPRPVFDPVGLPGSVTDALGSVPGIVQRPIDATGAVAAVVTGQDGVLTGPLGTIVTTVLDTKALGALTAPLKGVLGQLGRLTAQLLSQVIGLVKPVARLLEPIEGLGLTGGLVGETPIGSLLPLASPTAACPAAEPSSNGGSWPAAVVPAGSGQGATGGSVEQQIAHAPAVPADQPLGAWPHAATSRVLCGQWPQPPRSPDVAHPHMSGQSTDPFSPGDSNLPLTGTSNRALSSSSQNDGSGDTPRSWQARVPETFVPAGVVASPVVRTAADEPAFSPD